jgi:glycerol uptake facilitator-like aquaporin
VKDTFTTIGILSELEFIEQSYVKADPPLYDYSMLAEVKNKAMASEYAVSADIREYVMGYNEAIYADVKQGSEVDTYPYCMSIVTGICESIEFQNLLNYKAVLRIDYNDLNILPDYINRFEDPQLINILGTYITEDNKSPFKVGEKYMVYVMCYSYYINDGYINARIDKLADDYYKYEEYVEYDSTTMKEEFGELDENKLFLKLNDPSLYMMQKIDTTAYDYIENENGLWADRVESCKITQHSVELILTNRINSIYMFNTNEAYIVEGRDITDAEYTNGANVCIVSSSFAANNKLRIGDKLTLKVYENDFKILSSTLKRTDTEAGVWRSLEGKDKLDVWLSKGFDPDKGFFTEVEYEIVGAYATENRADRNEFTFTNNAVFVPQKSIDGDFNTQPTVHTISRYTDELIRTELLRTSIPGSFSVIIKNGYTDAFEKEMEEAGYGGIFYYFDQGYTKVSKILDEYNDISMLIALISILVWVTVVVVFITTYVSRSRRDVAIMRSLGTSKSKTYMSQLFTIILIALIAAIICSISGTVVYNKITDAVFADIAKDSNAVNGLVSIIDKSRNTVITAAIIQFFLTVISFAVILLLQVKQNVILLMKKAKKQ